MGEREGSGWRPWEFAQRCAIAAGVGLLALVITFFLWLVGHALLVMFAAILFALMLNGLAQSVSRYARVRRGWILGFTVSMITLLVLGVFVLGAFRIGEQAPQLRVGLLQATHELTRQLRRMGLDPAALGLGGIGTGSLRSGAAFFTRNLSRSLEMATEVLIIVIAGAYFAVSPRLYIRTVLMLVPPHRRMRFGELIEELGLGLRRWLLARVVSMVAVALMTMLGLSLLGVHLAILLGLIAGALTFIPYLGTIISLVPAVLMGLLQSPIVALYVALLFVGAHLLDGYLLSPLIQEKVVHLAPGWLILAQLIGGLAAGIFGIMIAAPVMVVVTIVIQMLYIEDILGERVRLLGR